MSSNPKYHLSVSAGAYRVPMPVVAVRCYAASPELLSYPLCPRCARPMER